MNAFRHTLAALLFASAFVSGPAKAQDPTIAKKFQGNGGGIFGVAVSGDGKFVVTGSFGKTAILWDVATGKKVRTFDGHTEATSCVAMSGDGKYVVTGSRDKSAILWDAANGNKLHTFQHAQPITSVALSRDGKHVVTASFDKTAILWDKASGKKIRTFSQDHAIFGVAVSDDSTKVLTGSSQDNLAHLWDAATGKKLQTFRGHTTRVMTVALSGDGTRVLTGSEDKTAILWDAVSGKLLHTLRGGDWMVTSVALSRDGKLALSGQVLTKSVGAILWDVGSGEKLQAYQTHGNNVLSVAFSDDGEYALTGCSDDSAMLWKVRGVPAQAGDLANELAKLKTRIADLEKELVLTKAALADLQRKAEKLDKPAVKEPQQEGKKAAVSAKEPLRIDQQEAIQKIVCSQDGTLLAIGTRTTLRVLEIPTAKERFEFTDMHLQGFALAPNGKTLAVMEGIYYGQGRVRFWQVDHYKPSPIFENDALPDSLVFSPDSKTLIRWGRSSSNIKGHLQKQGSIILWETTTRKKLREFEVSDVDMLGGYKCFRQSPDGKKLAIGELPEVFNDGFVANGDKQEKDPSKRGVIFAGPRGNPFVRIWEMETGKEIVQIKHHTLGATDFVFASGGQTLITVGCLNEICDARVGRIKLRSREQGLSTINGSWGRTPSCSAMQTRARKYAVSPRNAPRN